MARRGAKPFKPSCRQKGSWGLDAHPSGVPATTVARLRPRTVQQHIVQQAAGSSETHPAREHLTEKTAAAAAARNTVKVGTATATTSTVSLCGNASPTTAVRGLRASLTAAPVKRGNATVAGAPTGTSALAENGVFSRVVLGSKEGSAAAGIVAKGIAAIAEKKVLSAPADVVPRRRIDALSTKESVATPIGAERVAASAYEEISARSRVDNTTSTGTEKQQAAASVARADNATSTGTETLPAAASIRTVSVGSTVSANSAEAAVQATAAASTVADAQGPDAIVRRLGLGLRPVAGACFTSAGGIRSNRKIGEHFSVGRRTGHVDVFVRRDRPGIAASKLTTGNTAVRVGVIGGRTADTSVGASTKSAADMTFISSAAPNRLAVTNNFLKTGLFRVAAIPNAADSNSDVLTSLGIADDSAARLTERRKASKAEGDAETIKPINEVSVKTKPEAGSNVPTIDFPSTMGAVELSSTRESATGRTGMCEVGAAIPESSAATEIEGKRCQIASASQGVAETPGTSALCTGTAATELEQTSSETTTADIPPALRRDVSENELLSQKSEYNTAPVAKEDIARTTVDTTTAPRPKIAAGAAGYSGRAVVGCMPPYLKGTEKLGLRATWKEEKGSSLRTEGGATGSSELMVACGIERNCLPEEGVDMLVQKQGSIAGEREEDERGISGQTGATTLGTSCEVENAANGSSSSRGCSSDSSSTGMIDNSNTGKDTFDKRRNNSETVSTSICGNNSIGAFSLFGTETETKIKTGNGTGYCGVHPVRHEEGNWQPKRRTYSVQQPEQEAGRKGHHQRSKNRDAVRLRESLQSHSTNEMAGMHYLSRGEKSTRLQLYRMQGSYEERQQQQQENHRVQNVQGHGHSDASEAGKSCLHQQKQGAKEYKRPLNQQSQAREDELQMQQVPQPHCDKYVLGNRVEESCAQEVNEKSCKGLVNFKEETAATTQWRKEEITEKVTEPTATASGPTPQRVAAATAVALPAARRASSATAIRTITTTRAISPSPFLQKAPPGTISGKNVAWSRVAPQRATNKTAFKALTETEVETRQDIKAVGVLETVASVRENNQTAPQSAYETTSAAISQARRQGVLAEDRISLSHKRRKQVDRPLEDRQIGGVEVFVTVGWLSAFLPSSAGATEIAAPTVSRRAIATARMCPEATEYVGVSLSYKSAANDEGQVFRMWRVEDENAVGPLSPVLPLDNPYEVEIYEMSFQQQILALLQQHLDLSWSLQERERDGQQKEDRDGKAGQQRHLPPHKQVEVDGQKAAKRQQQKHKPSCLWEEPGSPEVPQTNSEQIKAEAQLQQLWQEPKKDPQSKPQGLRLYQRGYEDEERLQEEQLQGYGRGELLCQNWEKTLSALINALPHLLHLLWQHRQRLKKREKGRKMQQQEDTQEFLLHADYHLEQQVGCQDSNLLHLTLEHQQETQQQCEKTAQKQQQQQQPYEPSDWWEGQSLLDTRQKQEHTAHQFVNQAEEQKQPDKPFHKPTEAGVATKQLGKDNTKISDGILFDYIRAEVKKRVSEIMQQQQTRLDIQPLVEDAAAVSKYLEHLRAQQTVLQCQISLLQEQILHIAQQQATLEEQRYQLTFYRKCLKLRQGQVLQLSEIPSQHHKLPGMMEEHQQQLKWQTGLPEQEQVEQTIEQMRRDPRERPHEEKDSETCHDQELRGCFTLPQEAGNLRDMQQRAIRGQNDNMLSLDEQQQQLLLQLMQELSHRQEQQQYQQQSGDFSEIPRSQEEKCDCLAKAQQQQLQQTDEQFQIFMEQQQQQRKVDYPCMVGQEEEDEECALVGVLPQHQQQRADYLGSVSASLERILIKLTSSDSNLNAEAEARTDSGVDPSTSTQNLSTCNLSEMMVPATFPSAAASFATKSAAAPLLSASSLLSVLPAAPAAGIPPQSSQIPCQYRADEQSKHRQAIRQQWRFSGDTEHNEELLLNDHDCNVNNSSKGQQVAPVGRLPEATALAAPSEITPALSSMYGQPPEHLKSFPSSFSLRALPSNTITHVAACRSGRAEAGYAPADQEAPVNLTSVDSSSYLSSACVRAVADSHDATPTHSQAPGFLATIRAPQPRALLPPDTAATAPVTALALRGSAAAADVLTSGPSQEGGEQRQNGGGGGRSAREAGTALAEKNAVCLRLEVLTAAAAAFDDRAATGCKDDEANQSDTPEATARVAVLLEAWDWSGVKAAKEEGAIAIEEAADRAVVTTYAPITIDRLREDGDSQKQRGQDAWEERSQHQTKQQREQQQQQERTQVLLAENEFPIFETQFYYMSKAPVVVNRCDEDVLGTTTNPAAHLTDFDAAIGGKQAARRKASFPLVELQRETVVGMSTATISKAATPAANSYIAKQQEPAAAEGTAAAGGICSVIDAEVAAILEEVEGSEKKSVDALKTAFPWSPLHRCLLPYDGPAADLKRMHSSDWKQQKLQPGMENHMQQQYGNYNNPQQRQHGAEDKPTQEPVAYRTELGHQEELEKRLRTEQCWFSVAQPLTPASLYPSDATPFSAAPLAPRPADYSTRPFSLSDLVDSSIALMLSGGGAPTTTPLISYGFPYDEEKRDDQLVSQSDKPVPSAAAAAPLHFYEEGRTLTRAVAPLCTETAVDGTQVAATRIVHPKTTGNGGGGETRNGSCSGRETAVLLAFEEENGQEGKAAGDTERSSSWSPSATDQERLSSRIYSMMPPLYSGRHESYESRSVRSSLFTPEETGRGVDASSSEAVAAFPPRGTVAQAFPLPRATLTAETELKLPIAPSITSSRLALAPQAVVSEVRLPLAEALLSPRKAEGLESSITATIPPVEAMPLLPVGSPLPATSYPADVTCLLQGRSAGSPEATAPSATEHSCELTSPAFPNNRQYYNGASCLWKAVNQPHERERQHWQHEGEVVQWEQEAGDEAMRQQQEQDRRQRHPLQQAERQYQPSKDATSVSSELLLPPKDANATKPLVRHTASADSLSAAQRAYKEESSLQQQQRQEIQQQRVLRLPSVPVLGTPAAIEAGNHTASIEEDFYLPTAHARQSEPIPVVSASANRSRSAAPAFTPPAPVVSPLVYTTDKVSPPAAFPAPCLSAVDNRDSHTATTLGVCLHDRRGSTTTITAAALATTCGALEQCHQDNNVPVAAAPPRALLHTEDAPAPPPPPQLPRDSSASRGQELQPVPTVCTNDWACQGLHAVVEDCSEVLPTITTANLRAPLQVGTLAADTMTRKDHTGLFSCSSGPQVESAAEAEKAKPASVFEVDQHYGQFGYGRPVQQECTQQHQPDVQQQKEKLELLQHQLQRLAAQQQGVMKTMEKQQGVQQEQKLGLPQLQQIQLQQQKPQTCSLALEEPKTEETKSCGLLSFHRSPSLILQQYHQWQSEKHPFADEEQQQQPLVLCKEDRLNRLSCGAAQQQGQHDQEQPQQRHLGQDESGQQQENSRSASKGNSEGSHQHFPTASQQTVLTLPSGELMQPESLSRPMQMADCLCNQQAGQQRHTDKFNTETVLDIQVLREAAGPVDVNRSENNTGASFFRSGAEPVAAAVAVSRRTSFVAADVVIESVTGKRSQHAAGGGPYSTWDGVSHHRPAKQWYSSSSTSKNRTSSSNAIAVCIGRVEEGPRTRSPMASMVGAETVKPERHNAAVGMKQWKASVVKVSGVTPSEPRVQPGIRQRSGPHSDEGNPFSLSPPLSKAENTRGVTSVAGGTRAAVGMENCRGTAENWSGEKNYCLNLQDYENKEKASESGCNSVQGGRGIAALTEATAGPPGSFSRRAIYMQQQRLMRTRGQRFPCHSVNSRYIMHRQAGMAWREELPTAAAAPPPPPPPLLCEREAGGTSAISVGKAEPNIRPVEPGVFTGTAGSAGFAAGERTAAAFSTTTGAVAVHRTAGTALPVMPPPRATAAGSGMNWSDRRSSSASPSAGRQKRPLQQQQPGEVVRGAGRHLPPYPATTGCRGARQFFAQPQQNQHPQHYLNLGFGGVREHWGAEGKRQSNSSSHVASVTAAPEYYGYSRFTRKGCATPGKQEEVSAAADVSFSLAAPAAKSTSHSHVSHYNSLKHGAAPTVAATSAPCVVASSVSKGRVGEALIEARTQETPTADLVEAAAKTGEIEKRTEASAAAHAAAELCPGSQSGEHACAAGDDVNRTATGSTAERLFLMGSKRNEGGKIGSSSNELTTGGLEAAIGDGKTAMEVTEQQDDTEPTAVAPGVEGSVHYTHFPVEQRGSRQQAKGGGGDAAAAETTIQNDATAATEEAASPDAVRAATEVEEGSKRVEDERRKEEKGLTTVMLRNIPNKYNRHQVMKEIDVHFKGTYDFFYLPIDFVHGCNVGYCFINFLNVATAEAFRQEFEGKRLSLFKSRKICSVTYGRVQGLKAILEHYFHSAVVQVQYASWRPVVLKDCVELPWSELHKFFPELFENKFPSSSSPSISPSEKRGSSAGAATAVKRGHRSSSLSSASSSSSFSCANNASENHPTATSNVTEEGSTHAPNTVGKGIAGVVGAAALTATGAATTTNEQPLSQAHGRKNSGTDNAGVIAGGVPAEGVGAAASLQPRTERQGRESEYGDNAQLGAASVEAALQEDCLGFDDHPELDIAARSAGGEQLMFRNEEQQGDSNVQRPSKDNKIALSAGNGLHGSCAGTMTSNSKTSAEGTPGSLAAQYSAPPAMDAERSKTIEAKMETGEGTEADMGSTGGSLLWSRGLSIGRRRGRKLGVTIEARRRELRNLASKHVYATNRFASYRESFAAAAASAARQRIPYAYSHGMKLRFYTKSSSNGGARATDSVGATAAPNTKPTGTTGAEMTPLPAPAPTGYPGTAARILNVARCRGYIQGGKSVGFTEQSTQGTAAAAGATTAAEGGARVVAGERRAASAAARDRITSVRAALGVPAPPPRPFSIRTSAEAPGGSGAVAGGRLRRPVAAVAAGSSRSYLRRPAPPNTAIGIPQHPQHYPRRVEGGGGREDCKTRVHPGRLTSSGAFAFNSKSLYNTQQRPSSFALPNNRCLRLPGPPSLHYQLSSNIPERRDRRTEIHEQIQIQLQANSQRMQP